MADVGGSVRVFELKVMFVVEPEVLRVQVPGVGSKPDGPYAVPLPSKIRLPPRKALVVKELKSKDQPDTVVVDQSGLTASAPVVVPKAKSVKLASVPGKPAAK